MVVIKTLKYNLLSLIKILIYKIFFNTYYKYQHINSSEIIIHHHSGLEMQLYVWHSKFYPKNSIKFI